MSYQAKTDWQYGETPTEYDANRWEKGIKDANDATSVLTPQINSLETRVKALESSLANDMRDNRFAFDFSDVNELKIDAGWVDTSKGWLVIK